VVCVRVQLLVLKSSILTLDTTTARSEVKILDQTYYIKVLALDRATHTLPPSQSRAHATHMHWHTTASCCTPHCPTNR
jgi:hypothetical protein